MAITARRRADRARLKRKRRDWWAGAPHKTEVQLGRLIDTPTPCSCWMCGNPRRHLKKERRSIWERRWFQEVDDFADFAF
ncbi:hypothetical protein [Paraburkholderia graminis]|uniref:hypothetical protein n=1 Tax=Paraburkholderia graminis TaxID=60548 RepID=UPI00278D325F|nr:hypothetical protein [Paraburkholderia graminis]MDQ0622260.1 hypothetical protein [Paraburkholderia graminis]